MPAVSGQPRRSGWLARALALDGNPLLRGSDRAEAWIRACLIAVFLIAGPIAAVLTVPIMLVVVALTLLAMFRLSQLFLNRKRQAAWEAAWSAVAPRWTGHRP